LRYLRSRSLRIIQPCRSSITATAPCSTPAIEWPMRSRAGFAPRRADRWPTSSAACGMPAMWHIMPASSRGSSSTAIHAGHPGSISAICAARARLWSGPPAIRPSFPQPCAPWPEMPRCSRRCSCDIGAATASSLWGGRFCVRSRPSPVSYVTALITAATLVKICSISCSLTISGGASAMVSALIRTISASWWKARSIAS
jgi:hypothetical protein